MSTSAEPVLSRWIEASGTTLPPTIAGLDTIDWAQIESCRPERSGEIPFLLRALGGDRSKVACDALALLADHIEHQGSIYEATPLVIKALVVLLDEDRIPLTGIANSVRITVNRSGLFRFVPKARRDALSTKKNPLDGLVVLPQGGFNTFRAGTLHGPSCDILYGGDSEEGEYVDGKRTGPWKFSYASGAQKAEGVFEAGKRNGPWTDWYENGRKEREGAWALGKRTGPWWAGSRDGQRVSVGIYKNDLRHGIWEETWPDGTTTTRWKNGKQMK